MSNMRFMGLLLLMFTLSCLTACGESEPLQPTTAPVVVEDVVPTVVPTSVNVTKTVPVPTETVVETIEVESTPEPVVATGSIVDGGLEVVGNEFYYNSEPVFLKGISIGEISEFNMPEFSWTDPRIQFIEMKGWGANTVRLSVHPGFWETQYHSERELLRELVDIATEENMIVIIDWHVIGWPGTFSATDTWHSDMNLYNADFNLAKQFWTEIAAEYKGYDNLILEIWNEAIHPEAMDEIPEKSWWPVLKLKHEELIEVIRGEGNTSPILVSGPSWSYDLRGIKDDPPYDPISQLAYSWHAYAGNGGDDPNVWEVALDGLYETTPVVLGEWGFEEVTNQHWQGTANVYGSRMKKFILDKGLHPIAWNWNPYYGPSLWTEQDASRMSQWGIFVYKFFTENE